MNNELTLSAVKYEVTHMASRISNLRSSLADVTVPDIKANATLGEALVLAKKFAEAEAALDALRLAIHNLQA